MRHHPYNSQPTNRCHQPDGDNEELLSSILKAQNELKDMVKGLTDRVEKLEEIKTKECQSPSRKLPVELSVCW